MEHIAAEKGSALEMVQKVTNLIWQYLIILLLYIQIKIFDS